MDPIGSFTTRIEAEVAASMLQAHGIDATVAGDDAGGSAGINLAARGYGLLVAPQDRDDALELLDELDGGTA